MTLKEEYLYADIEILKKKKKSVILGINKERTAITKIDRKIKQKRELLRLYSTKVEGGNIK